MEGNQKTRIQKFMGGNKRDTRLHSIWRGLQSWSPFLLPWPEWWIL